MKKLITGSILVICLFFSLSYGSEIIVIARKDFPADRLTKKELKEIYLKIRTLVHGVPVYPVNLPPDSPLRNEFQEKILNMDSEQLNIYWNEMYFHGVEPPLVLSSERAVIKFVKKVKGAVGYIRKKKLDKSLKILFIIRETDR
ncbi:hypothetical protein [Persephonella sp.]